MDELPIENSSKIPDYIQILQMNLQVRVGLCRCTRLIFIQVWNKRQLKNIDLIYAKLSVFSSAFRLMTISKLFCTRICQNELDRVLMIQVSHTMNFKVSSHFFAHSNFIFVEFRNLKKIGNKQKRW